MVCLGVQLCRQKDPGVGRAVSLDADPGNIGRTAFLEHLEHIPRGGSEPAVPAEFTDHTVSPAPETGFKGWSDTANQAEILVETFEGGAGGWCG